MDVSKRSFVFICKGQWFIISIKVKESRYRPGVAQRDPGM